MATLSSRLVADAKRVHARLLELKRQKNLHNAELAQLLARVKRRKLYRVFTKTSVGEYAVHFGFTTSTRKARELVQMIEDLEHAPEIREAFQRGDFEWTKVRTAATAIASNPASAPVWLERLRGAATSTELENLAREERGEPTPIRWSLRLTREEEADLEQALATARAQHGRRLTDAQALAIVCRSWRATQAGGGEPGRSSERPANRIVVSRCGDCGKAWQETRSGRVAVSPERLEAAACDAEISDVRDGPARITKTVPPKIRRHVLDRDGHRCRVPGCSSVGYLHVHHEPGREVSGHDPGRMAPLCDEHHLQRHCGLLEIREEGDGRFRFFQADGTEIASRADEAPGSCEPPANGTAPPEACSYEPPATDPAPAKETRSCEPSAELRDADNEARETLLKLGMRPGEATSAVWLAREALALRGEGITLEALVKEALPSPRAG